MRRVGGRLAPAFALLLLMGCGSEARMVVQIGKPISETVASSEGYEPYFLDEQGNAPLGGPRGTSYVTASELRVLFGGVEVFHAAGPVDVQVNTFDGTVKSVDALTKRRVPLTDAPAFVERVRSEVLAQGWVDLAACPYEGTDAEVWTRCTEPWSLEMGGLDAAGKRPLSARMHFEHAPGVYMQAKVRCSEEKDGKSWRATPVFLLSTKPTCINASGRPSPDG